MNRHSSQPLARPGRCGAFTLIEVMVVIAIVVVLLAVSVPTIRALTGGNRQAQTVNLVRSYLADARAIALSQHRMAGVVFFEENPSFHTKTGAPPANTSQTAMQIFIQDPDQSGYTKPNTGFIYYNRDRQYLPRGIQIATLNDSTTNTFLTGDESTGLARCVLFNPTGQMILLGYLARPNANGTNVGGYPQLYQDWNFNSPGTTSKNLGVSSPGLIVFDLNDYQNQHFASTAAKMSWLQQHADVLILNPYTGSLVQ